MAPTMASDDDIFSAEKKYGRQYGTRSLRNICVGSARMVRNRSWKSASGALRPFTVLTSTGKNEISTAAATFDHQPVPSHSTRSGAMATIGVVLRVIAMGNNPCS